ncbi:MAG: hypothetical protein V3U82_06120 [Robiginitomaculum sp.]
MSAGAVDRPFLRAASVVILWGGSDFYENDWEAPVVSDFYLLDNIASGQAGADIITGDVIPVNFPFDPISDGSEGGWPYQISGQTSGGVYTNNASYQMLDANDSYSAFGIDGGTDIDLLGTNVRYAWFFVASNTAFDIYGQASSLTASGDFSGLGYDNIRYNLYSFSPPSGSIGQRAQDPAVGGAGIVIGQNGTLWTLDDLSSGPTKVFDGGRRTARIRGTIAQQSTGFASVYRLRGAAVTGNNYDLSMGTGVLMADVTYTVYAP